MTELAVALGAVLGAPARYLLDSAVTTRLGSRLPLGVLLVNLLGCAAAGLLAGLDPSPRVAALLGVGFLGSFTTASTVAWDVLSHGTRLLLLHVVPGVALAALGLLVGRAL